MVQWLWMSVCLLCFVHGSGQSIQEFKIMGERNTGTRYLQQLLNKNLEINHLHLKIDGKKLNSMNEIQKDHIYEKQKDFWGWKHACAPTRAYIGLHTESVAKTLFVVTAKNPYSWLLSMWRHPYHYVGDRPETFDKFLRRPWTTVGREKFEDCGGGPRRHEKHQQFFKTPIEMWNLKLRSFATLSTPYVAKVRYEDLVRDPAAVVQEIRQNFQLTSGTESQQFENIQDSTKTKEKDYKSYRDFYLEERWKDKWDCIPCLKFVNYGLDNEVLKMWGYERWQGLPEAKVNQLLNGQPSWMLSARPGSDPRKKKKDPTYVSLNTLKRQKQQAAKMVAHRKANPNPGHAPKKWNQGGNMQELKKAEAWLKADVNQDYGEPPTHSVVGGPMGGLSLN